MHSLLDRKKKKSKGSSSSSCSGVDAGLQLSPLQSGAAATFPLQRQPQPPPPAMCSSVGCFWMLLACALLAVCTFSFLSPAWIVLESSEPGKPGVNFGLLWRCFSAAKPPYREQNQQVTYHVPSDSCSSFRPLGRFAEIPSSSWQTSAVLCSGGCTLLAMSCILAIINVFLPSGLCERRICTLAGYMQMAAVFIMASGLLIYPFGLNNKIVSDFCGNSTNIYYAGNCKIGWGYMLAIVGVMLSVFLPFFAKYAPKEPTSPTPIPTIL